MAYWSTQTWYWPARERVDTVDQCPGCGNAIEARQLVTRYRRLESWTPGEVRHYRRTGCGDEFDYEAV